MPGFDPSAWAGGFGSRGEGVLNLLQYTGARFFLGGG